jgi:hypothetical protein|tara:strand:- start:102 stop:278 length:177 start_codon:yes stop_codon:yes gene_type:complete
MTLYEKIIQIYPALEGKDFYSNGILLQNDGDDRGDYIKEWNHATLSEPTQSQLDEAGG